MLSHHHWDSDFSNRLRDSLDEQHQHGSLVAPGVLHRHRRGAVIGRTEFKPAGLTCAIAQSICVPAVSSTTAT
jgi:hypothetical protein